MKASLFFIAVLTGCLILSSCKKGTDEMDNRTGLELLTDSKAGNYLVFVEGRDTFVWQDIKGDKVEVDGGLMGSDKGSYIFASAKYKPAKPGRIKDFYLSFEAPTNEKYYSNSCSWIDSVAKEGTFSLAGISAPGLTSEIGVYDNTLNLSTVFNTANTINNYKIEVLSTKRIETTTGCYKVRIKAKFTNVKMPMYPGCPIYDYIKEGVIQVDLGMPIY